MVGTGQKRVHLVTRWPQNGYKRKSSLQSTSRSKTPTTVKMVCIERAARLYSISYDAMLLKEHDKVFRKDCAAFRKKLEW